jgi:adenylosuccinate synthase
MEEERLSEGGGGQSGGGKTIGTTGRGIGPCYADKIGRHCAIRVGDLLQPDHLRQRLADVVERKNRLLHGLCADARTFDANALADEYIAAGEQLRPHVTDTMQLLHKAIAAGKSLLFEAAQGSLLDVDHGSYPFVTSSHSSPAGIWTGTGVPARKLTRVIGIAKAYTSRVGGGPFPTELTDGPDGIGERIRRIGREYGTVTGRPRRCGWFDTVGVRYTATLAGADEVALMLLDVLSGLDEVRVAVGYQLDGKRVDWFPADAHTLERCQPIYETLPGWREDISGARKLADLPSNARRYIDRLVELLGLPVRTISVGPDRDQTIPA